MESPHFHVVLVEPEIPQNTGNIGRLCVGANCSLHLVQPLGFSLEDRYMKRAGLDYWKYLDWHLHNSFEEFLEKVNPKHFYFFSKKAAKEYWDVSLQQGDALVFGKETLGLPESLIEQYPEKSLTAWKSTIAVHFLREKRRRSLTREGGFVPSHGFDGNGRGWNGLWASVVFCPLYPLWNR